MGRNGELGMEIEGKYLYCVVFTYMIWWIQILLLTLRQNNTIISKQIRNHYGNQNQSN